MREESARGPGRPPLENTPEAVLKLERRRRIFELVRERPGITVNEVRQALDIGAGPLQFHLRRLYRVGLLVTHETDEHTYLYVAADAPPKKNLWPSETSEALAYALIAQPGRRTAEIAEELGLDQRVVQRHIARLLEEGLVFQRQSREDSRFVLYYPSASLRRRVRRMK